MAPGVPQGERIAAVSAQFVSAASLRVRSDWFNKLRWGAALGVLVGSAAAGLFSASAPLIVPLVAIGVLLLLLNAGYVIRNRRIRPRDIVAELRLVKMQMVADLVLLTAVLHFTGGVENPFQFIYIVHVIIASLLFKGREIFQIAWLAIGLFTLMVLGEHLGPLHHHHLLSASDLTHELPYMLMSLGSVWLVLLTSAYIGASIMHHNRSIKDELVDRQGGLVEAGKAQLDFFRFVTHEVKSPIVTAQSAVEAARELLEEGAEPVVRDMLDRAVRRLTQALGIVRDLADLTQGRMAAAPHWTDVDLALIVARTLEQQQESMAARGLTLEADLPTAPLTVYGDEGMIEKVVVNLLNNAVRYNRDGGSVSVTLVPTGDGVRFAVADTGIGIAGDDLERIFDEFYRAPEAREMTNVGTGLGLPIVRRFLQQMGGAVEVTSTPGQGSLFTVTLPKKHGAR